MQGFSFHHKRRCLYAPGMSEEGKEKINSRVQRSPLLELTAQKFELKWVSARFTGTFSPRTVIVLCIYISKNNNHKGGIIPLTKHTSPVLSCIKSIEIQVVLSLVSLVCLSSSILLLQQNCFFSISDDFPKSRPHGKLQTHFENLALYQLILPIRTSMAASREESSCWC